MTNYPHNSPGDRGSADAYYGKRPRPHKRTSGVREALDDPKEVIEYWEGYNNEDDRKSYR